MKIQLTRYCPACKRTTKHEHDTVADTFDCRPCYRRSDAYRFAEEVAQTYNDCGPDLGWAHRAPEDEEFVDVMRDLMASRMEDRELAEKWSRLPQEEKRRIILSVGP